MTDATRQQIGFTCRYTPLPLIHAAGFTPYRVLPMSETGDHAGSLLHDNMCGHVKRALDRVLADDLPAMAGIVIMNSCDAMRRLAGAWRHARPDDRLVSVELPAGRSAEDVAYLASELHRLRGELERWTGRPITDEAIRDSAALYRRLARRLDELAGALADGRRAQLQETVNRAVTSPPEHVLRSLEGDSAPPEGGSPSSGVPVLLIGNVLPDPEALAVIEECGATIVADDLCTGTRQIPAFDLTDSDPLAAMASQLLESPPCARTMDASRPNLLAELVVQRACDAGARGVIAHVPKFCDPYLVRMPAVQAALRDAGLPLLLLEGDCSLGAVGQQRTRIAAFVEMLGGAS